VHQHTDVTNKLSRKKMEIYVMKKKFVLTLALVLVVAGTLVAATPIEVSGSFKTGYDFAFNPQSASQIENANEAEIETLVALTGDFWKVSLNAENIMYNDEDPVQAKAELYLDKALAAEGIDMGDLALTLHVGTGVSGDALTVLADKNDFRADDGTGVGMATTGDNFGVTVKYADMVEVYASVDPTLKALPMVVGAKLMPIDGVTAAVGFTNDYTAVSNNAFVVSADADVAALAGLDFALATTGEFIYDLGAETFAATADVAGEYAGIGLWVAYYNDMADVNKLATKASYSTIVSGFDLSASFKVQMDDLSDIANTSTYTIATGAGYAMGGVSYALDAEYVIDGAFTLTPSVSISF
jgi:hypothetical protein